MRSPKNPNSTQAASSALEASGPLNETIGEELRVLLGAALKASYSLDALFRHLDEYPFPLENEGSRERFYQSVALCSDARVSYSRLMQAMQPYIAHVPLRPASPSREETVERRTPHGHIEDDAAGLVGSITLPNVGVHLVMTRRRGSEGFVLLQRLVSEVHSLNVATKRAKRLAAQYDQNFIVFRQVAIIKPPAPEPISQGDSI